MSTPAYLGSPGNRGNTASAAATCVVTLTSAVPAGHHLILVMGHSSQAASSSYTVASSVGGNVWSKDAEYEFLPNRGVVMFSSPITTLMAIGATVTVTSTVNQRMSAVFLELDQPAVVDGTPGNDHTTSTGTAINPTTTSTGPALIVGPAVSTGVTTMTRANLAYTLGPSAVTAIGTTPEILTSTQWADGGSGGVLTPGWTVSPAGVTAGLAVAYKSAPVVGALPDDIYMLVAGVWQPAQFMELVAGTWS